MQICRCKVSDIITKRKKNCAKLTFCKKKNGEVKNWQIAHGLFTRLMKILHIIKKK